jgi:predicted GNAT family acetyltransferase
LARSGIQPQKNGRGGEFQGIFNGADLVAAALAIENRLLLLESHSKQSAHELGVWFRRHQIPLEHIVSGAEAVDGFWNGYSGGGDVPRARADLAQKLYRLPRQRWQAQSHASSTDPSGLRRADIGDVEAVLEASARMHLEETGIDAMTRSPHTFIRHVTQRIEFGHTFVIVDRHGELVFKAEVSAQSRYGAQISGVFTRAEKRRQGFGFRGLCALIDQLFSQGFPLVTLYVNSENIAARKLYEKVAFEPHCDYRTIFVTPR